MAGAPYWWAEDPLTIEEDSIAAARRALLKKMGYADNRYAKSLARQFGDAPMQLGFDMGMGRTASALGAEGAEAALGAALPEAPLPGQMSMLTDAGVPKGSALPRGAMSALGEARTLSPFTSKLMSPGMLRAASIGKSVAGPLALGVTAASMLPGAYDEYGFGFHNNEGKPTFLGWLAGKAKDIVDGEPGKGPGQMRVGASTPVFGRNPQADRGAFVWAKEQAEHVDSDAGRKAFLRKKGYDVSTRANYKAAAVDWTRATRSHPTTKRFVENFGAPTGVRDPLTFNRFSAPDAPLRDKR